VLTLALAWTTARLRHVNAGSTPAPASAA
jgi:hypothetical protein